MKFCENCANRLEHVFSLDDMQFYCYTCNEYTPASARDTMIKSSGETSTDHPQLYETLIQTCYNDHANPKERIYCKKCKTEVIARFVRITQHMKKIYVCPEGHIQDTSGY